MSSRDNSNKKMMYAAKKRLGGTGMKVLVIGKGGREHAIADAFHRSVRVDKIYAAPGNPGMAKIAECVDIAAENVEELVR